MVSTRRINVSLPLNPHSLDSALAFDHSAGQSMPSPSKNACRRVEFQQGQPVATGDLGDSKSNAVKPYTGEQALQDTEDGQR
jgi:hypothetical protein